MHSPTFYREGRTIRVGGTEYKVQTAQAGGEFVSASGDVRQLKPFAGSRGDAWELVAQPVHDSGTLNLTNLPPTHCMDTNACIRMPYHAPYPTRIQMKRMRRQRIMEVVEAMKAMVRAAAAPMAQ